MVGEKALARAGAFFLALCLHRFQCTSQRDLSVILGRDQEEAWLDKGLKEPADLMPILRPYPADEMELYPVSKLVNKPTVDRPELVEPADG